MKTKNAKTPRRRKQATRREGRSTETKQGRGFLGWLVVAVLAAGVGFGSYRAGEAFSGKALPDNDIVISVAQAGVESVARVGKERAKVKGASGSVFSEGDAPTVVGDIPAGWRVETSTDVKAKFGPQPVPGGEDITFVVPVYTLVPEERRPGAYVMEPGRNTEGIDAGGTLKGVLDRMQGEATAIGTALATLSESLKGLEGMAPEVLEGDPVEGAEGAGEGQ